MNPRLKKLDRVRKVQKQLHTMAEWELVRLQRKGAELEAAQVALIETLNDDEKLYGLFVDAAAKRLQSLAAQANQVEADRLVQAGVTLDRAMQVKRTEKMVTSLKEVHRRETEKSDLLGILDSIAARGDASPAKAT
ncbi:hypothetical protein [Microvirga massiliensis]|uniref:hypothetical protein n=1 Tax=Microvirga massiliensis TaxID=1033741 RepID=UPI000A6F1706|nr:hypothetical protein [Microvirga massiliensis]